MNFADGVLQILISKWHLECDSPVTENKGYEICG